jgi:hypothetical protein
MILASKHFSSWLAIHNISVVAKVLQRKVPQQSVGWRVLRSAGWSRTSRCEGAVEGIVQKSFF